MENDPYNTDIEYKERKIAIRQSFHDLVYIWYLEGFIDGKPMEIVFARENKKYYYGDLQPICMAKYKLINKAKDIIQKKCLEAELDNKK